jgi:hypothetical protein
MVCNFVTTDDMVHNSFRESRNFSAAFECTLYPFQSNILVLTVSAKGNNTVRIKIICALDRSVYKAIKHGYTIKINCLVSVRAEMSNRNIKLWNSSITNVLQIQFFHSCVLASLARYLNFCVLLSVLTSDFLFLCFPWIKISFLIDCNVLECGAWGLMLKVDKWETCAEGRCGCPQTHSWRTE